MLASRIFLGCIAARAAVAVRVNASTAPDDAALLAEGQHSSASIAEAFVLTADAGRLQAFEALWPSQIPLQAVQGPHPSDERNFDQVVSPWWHVLEPKEKVGAMLCAAGHKRVLERIAGSAFADDRWFAVFEDDARIQGELDLDAIARDLPADARLVQLFSAGISESTKLGRSCRSPAGARVHTCHCAYNVAFLVTKAAAATMLQQFPLKRPIDIEQWSLGLGLWDFIATTAFGTVPKRGVYVVNDLPIVHGSFPSVSQAASRMAPSPSLISGLPDRMLAPGTLALASLVLGVTALAYLAKALLPASVTAKADSPSPGLGRKADEYD